MPLSPDLLLIADHPELGVDVPPEINEIAASCSWDFFITRDRGFVFERLIPTIRQRSQELVDGAVDLALKKHD